MVVWLKLKDELSREIEFEFWPKQAKFDIA
jgi:hypothetical protein